MVSFFLSFTAEAVLAAFFGSLFFSESASESSTLAFFAFGAFPFCCFFFGFSSGLSNSLSLGGEDSSSDEVVFSGSVATFFLFLGHGSLSSEVRFFGFADFEGGGGELWVSS